MMHIINLQMFFSQACHIMMHIINLQMVADVLVDAGFLVFPGATTSWGGFTHINGTTPTKNPEVDCGC